MATFQEIIVAEYVREQAKQVIIAEYNKNHDGSGRFTFGKSGKVATTKKPARARDTVPEFMGNDPHAPTKIAKAYNLTHKPTEPQIKKIVADALGNDPKLIARFNKDRVAIQARIDNGEETHKLYGVKFDKNGDVVKFNHERTKMHAHILVEEFGRIDSLPTRKPPVLTVIMGRPGSGKSSFEKHGSKSTPWAAWDAKQSYGADPDYFKGRIGAYDKNYSNPNTVGLVHEESSFIYKKAVKYALQNKKSIVMDQTLGSNKYDAVKAFADAGYEVKLYGVSTSVGSSIASATERYAIPLKSGSDIPGRLVPPKISASNTTNEANFEKLIPLASEYSYYTSKLGTDAFDFNLVATNVGT